MAWQYSDPLNGALLAASKNSTSDIGLGSAFQPFYSSYDPLFSRYQPRSTFFNRQPASINIFDEIDATVAVAPLVVVPADQFEEAVIKFDAAPAVED